MRKKCRILCGILALILCLFPACGKRQSAADYGETLTATPPTYTAVEAPAADSLETYDLTAERLKEAYWDKGAVDFYSTFEKDGTMTVSGTQGQSFACLTDRESSFDKLLNMDIQFECQSVLAPGNKLTSYAQIMLRAEKIGELHKTNPCYFLEYEDNGDFSIRAGRYGADGLTFISRDISVEALYKPHDFNNLKVGVFNEGSNVRVLVYFNGVPIINALDENPGEEYLRPGYTIFQNAAHTLRFRGVDTQTELAVARPVPVKTVGDIQTYDISGLKDYNFRSLITVMTARTWKDNNGVWLPYRIYLPTNYSPDKKYPLAMYLHGSGLNGMDNLHSLGGDVNFHKAFLDYQSTEEFIYVVPQCPAVCWNKTDYDISKVIGQMDWEIDSATTEESPETTALWHLLAALTEEFSVDEDRLYIAGASAGGMGAYGLLGRYPDLFAGAIIGCAAGDTSLAANYSPVVIAHGTLDPAILIERGREMRDVIEAAGGEVLYYEYPDRYHDFSNREEIVGYIDWIFNKIKV